MREGRRQRLGLQEGTEGTVQDTYLDRILEQEGPRTLALDPGAFVDTRDQRYVQDAYNYYLGGGTGEVPEATAQIPGAIDTLVDAGGGGGGIDQATGGVDLGGNTDFEQNLIDQGIGVQGAIGDPVVAPGEIPYTQEQMDAENAIPVTQPSFDDQFQDIEDIQQTYGTPINIGFGEGQVDPGLAAGLEGPIVDTSPVTPTITAPSGDVFAVDDPLAAEKIDFAPEQQGLIDQAFSKVGSTASDIMNDLSQIPGAVADFTNQTVDILGKKINVGKTLLSAGINKIVGGPISLVFDALGAIQSDPIDAATKEGLEEKGYGFDDIGRLTTGPMEGYAVESGFGDGIADATLDRIDKIENRDAPQTEDSIEKVEELYDFLGDVTEVKAAETAPQEDVGAISGDMNTGADPVSGDLPGGGNIGDEFGSRGDTQATTGPTVSRSDKDYGQFGRAQSAQAGGGGNQGGGGKIVCTMMNDSYGFGSFRNKIWLKHSKDLAPEYQIGYHKIFLPLVKLSKTNKVLKKTLEHIAVHRTIDIRQETRGKMHLLGRIYRKILEPICYIVGKHAKR